METRIELSEQRTRASGKTLLLLFMLFSYFDASKGREYGWGLQIGGDCRFHKSTKKQARPLLAQTGILPLSSRIACAFAKSLFATRILALPNAL